MGPNLLVFRRNPSSPTRSFTPSSVLQMPRLASRWLACALLFSGCRWMPPRSAAAGHLEASWSGPNGGTISASASAEWCGARRLLEIRAVQGDTGIAFALYPKDTLLQGRYRVVDPLRAESLPPAAGLALRWFTQNAVKGFQGDTGTVLVDRSPSGELGGSVTARARSIVDTQQITVRGTFRGLTVHPSVACVLPRKGPARGAPPSDTVVH
jgi:hypothetical protein